MNFLFSFLFFLQWSLHWIHLFWNGGQPQLQISIYGYMSSNSTFSCTVAFLCLLGELLASLVALRMCPLVLFSVYSITLNVVKNTWELWEFTFYCNMQFTWDKLLRWGWLVSHGILSRHLYHLGLWQQHRQVSSKLL